MTNHVHTDEIVSREQLKALSVARRRRQFLRQLPGDIIKLTIVILFVFPFYWMISTGFKSYIESIQTPPTLWPHTFTLDNFRAISEMNINIFMYGKNSVLITVTTIALQMLIMVPAAYAFAKRDFPLKGVLFGVVLLAFMIPGQLTYISIYLMMSKAKLLQTLWPQILPFGANAFGIFMLRQSFKQIPEEIVESARLDSASELQIMARIMLPMSKSAMITIAMFSFISIWNNYFWPLVMTTNEAVRPLTMAIQKLRDSGDSAIRWNVLMAGNVILVVPVLIIYVFASKKILQAFAYNGMK